MEHSFFPPGNPVPWFSVRSPAAPNFHFDTVAGRKIVLLFAGSTSQPQCRAAIDALVRRTDIFDGANAALFLVSVDPRDEQSNMLPHAPPGVFALWDFDRAVSRQFGTADPQGSPWFVPRTFVLDHRLRVFSVHALGESAEDHAAAVIADLARIEELPGPELAPPPAPILVVPRIFESGLCQALMQYYDQLGGVESGFVRDVDGRTVTVSDPGYKRRRDQEILDEKLRQACMERIHDRLVPEIYKAFQFRATRIERYIVACYDSQSGGFFRAHRDNTTRGTAHRRFAVSLNLNTGDFEGGLLRFPEFGQRTYLPPAGGAVVFSCSLLHEATPVTSGRRFVFLPFLYGDVGARIRQENAQFVARPGN